MTKVGEADRVLEVACGPGAHSLLLAGTFLKKGGMLVSCDISRSMITRLANRYRESAFC